MSDDSSVEKTPSIEEGSQPGDQDQLGVSLSAVTDHAQLALELVEQGHKILTGTKVTAGDKKKLSGLLSELTGVICRQSCELQEARALLAESTVQRVKYESMMADSGKLRSYADVAKEDTAERTGEKRKDESKEAKVPTEHVLIVRPKKGGKMDSKALSAEMRSSIPDPKGKGIGVQWTRPLHNGGVLVKVDSPKDLSALQDALTSHETLGPKVDVVIPKKRAPRIIIYDVPSTTKSEEVVDALSKQASIDASMVRAKFGINKNDSKHWVMELDPPAFNVVRKVGNIKIDWASCRVGEHLRPTQCYKCGGYGHIAKSCQSAECCMRCSKPGHRAKDCKSKKFCGNCNISNKKASPSGQKVETAHGLLDQNCPCRRIEREAMAKRTNYG